MKKQFENTLSEAVGQMIPEDFYERISQNIVPAQQERTRTMKTTERKPSRTKWISLAAAACLLLAVGTLGIPYYTHNYVVDSMVNIDVNPSVELTTNQNDRVLTVTAINEDGKNILDGMDLRKTDLKIAVNAIIGSMVRNGYIVDGENGILVSVQNDDAEKASRVKDLVLSDINASLDTNHVSAAVLNQTLTETDTAKAFALAHGISTGKAVFVLNLAGKDSSLSAERLAPMSLKEITAVVVEKGIDIRDIVDYEADEDIGEMISDTVEDLDEDERENAEPDAATGATTTQKPSHTTDASKRISAARAKELALSHAGVSARDAVFEKVELDSDDGRAVYDIAFHSGTVEYEYEIDATSGAVISAERDVENRPDVSDDREDPDDADDDDADDDDGPDGDVPADTSKLISAARAKELALSHAGVSARDAAFGKVALDSDDGRAAYDITFHSGTVEYEYEIDAVSGAVISAERDVENRPDASDDKDDADDADDEPDEDAPADAPKLISAARAKELALSHAGISAGDATFEKAELDSDDGKAVYDLVFHSGSTEYAYEIDAKTGAVRSHQSKKDD